MCTFRDRFDAFNSMNAQVYGVSVDGIFAQKAFSDANNLNFPLLSDFKRETVDAYGVALPNFAGMDGYTASQRAVFVIDKEGVIKFKWVGENPGVEPDYDEVQRQVDQLN
jgi:peroxiredoxin